MYMLKKIFNFNSEKIDNAIKKEKNIKRHKLISRDQFMSSFNESQKNIEELRNSIQNTKQ